MLRFNKGSSSHTKAADCDFNCAYCLLNILRLCLCENDNIQNKVYIYFTRYVAYMHSAYIPTRIGKYKAASRYNAVILNKRVTEASTSDDVKVSYVNKLIMPHS